MRSCFCHNMMSISDHCLPSRSEDEIEQVGSLAMLVLRPWFYKHELNSNTDTGVYTNSNTDSNPAQGRASNIVI